MAKPSLSNKRKAFTTKDAEDRKLLESVSPRSLLSLGYLIDLNECGLPSPDYAEFLPGSQNVAEYEDMMIFSVCGGEEVHNLPEDFNPPRFRIPVTVRFEFGQPQIEKSEPRDPGSRLCFGV